MRSIIIDKNLSGKRIDKIIRILFPKVQFSDIYNAFKKKDVKVNGIRVKENFITNNGDKIEIFISDIILEGKKESIEQNEDKQDLDIIFEDENIIIVNKKQGISVHYEEGYNDGSTLIDLVLEYLNYNSLQKFKPSLCHRLDRNTGGLVIIAKQEEAYKSILTFIKERKIIKYYLCYVKGVLKEKEKEMKAYLTKDSKNSFVHISDYPKNKSLTIITKYKVLKNNSDKQDISFVEVELVTGRTHQIRAHFAHIGHPLLGDGKYGINTFNKKFGAKYQALWAYKIVFDFKKEDGNVLNYLSEKTFQVKPEFKFSKITKL